jgi:hypothetical protein
MEQEPIYLIRYGLRGHVGKFPLDPAAGFSLQRGQMVVVHTDRGEEAGEVLVPVHVSSPSSISSTETTGSEGYGFPDQSEKSPQFRSVRLASDADLEKMTRCAKLRGERFAICQRILEELDWPLELIDVEPLLDQNTTVIHYLGPPDLDLAMVRARFRNSCDFDILFEPLSSGQGSASEPASSNPAAQRNGGCGDCDCTDGGCGKSRAGAFALTQAEDAHEADATAKSCNTSAHAGCSSCGISSMRSRTRHSGR